VWFSFPLPEDCLLDDNGAVAVGYYRRGDLATSLMPATYFVHGLAGYAQTAMMSAHALPAAAFLSAGVDPLTYAAIPTYAHSAAGAAAQLHGSGYNSMQSNVGSDAATNSELSPASTQNGTGDNSNGVGTYTPPGFGELRMHLLKSFSTNDRLKQ